jgi:heat shock protein HslJ/membrane-bound inhibitor of C-type lysozyme
MRTRPLATLVVALISLAVGPVLAQPPVAGLGGTSWQLVRFEGGDGTTLTPDDKAKYTLTFNADGTVAARLDCNRGRGTWKSPAAPQLQLGPMALTRAMCPPGSLHDRIVKDWDAVRSYVLKNGHLFLSLMADGGIYEFEPLTPSPAAGATTAPPKSPVASRGPFTFQCTSSAGAADALTVTFYATQPGTLLLERAGQSRLAFQVRAASGAKYEGADLLFWEARGEATVNWSGVALKCRQG